jgi:hypothetical protein
LTKNELFQLRFLNHEAKQIQTRIEELEGFASSCTAHITGLPKISVKSDIIGKYASELADIKKLLELKQMECLCQFDLLNRFIQSVDDSEMRQILTYRYISGFQWDQIAVHIGYGASEDSVRKAHDRFLQKN